jgi:hypothetical protein
VERHAALFMLFLHNLPARLSAQRQNERRRPRTHRAALFAWSEDPDAASTDGYGYGATGLYRDRGKDVPRYQIAVFPTDCRTKQRPIVFGKTPGAEVVMKHRSEVVPLAIMGSLTAAIMVVFAVTVMH